MDNKPPISPVFIKSVQLGLDYWASQTKDLSDEAIHKLDAERANLYRMVQYGLMFSQLYQPTAVVVLQSCDLIERKGYWQEGIQTLNQIIPLIHPNKQLQGQLYNRLGRLYQLNRELDKAVQIHLLAEEIAVELQDPALLSQTQFNLCVDYRQLRQYDLCEQYGILALTELESRVADHRLQAATYNELGLAAHYRGDFAIAEERLQTAVVLYRQLDVPTYVVRVLNNLIGLARAQKKYDTALSYYDEGSQYYHRLSSEFDKVALEVARGGTLFELGKYSEAEHAFRQANSPYLQNSMHISYRALVTQCIGNALLKQKRYEDAADFLSESAKLWQMANDTMLLANTLGTLGELYMERGHNQTAVSYFDQAIELLTQHPNDINATRLLKEFAGYRQTVVA